MAQHDYVISNQTFPLTRQDINNALASIVSNNSDATEPTTMYAYQWWFDTSTNTLKFRNADNDAWISFATFDMVNDTVNLVDSAVDIVTDLSPQLGANLDLNSNDITGTGNINITGTIDSTGDITGGSISLADNNKILLGDSGEFQIWHTSGGGSNITESGSGSLSLNARDIFLGDIAGTKRLKIDGNLGDVIFYEDTGASAKFIWDASAERIGIGTALPEGVLHIKEASVADFKLESTSGKKWTISSRGPEGVLQFYNSTDALEAMRIQSDGDVLISKTSNSLGTVGIELSSAGKVSATRDGDPAMSLNRLSSDGNILDFRKDTTTVGNIGAEGSALYLGTGDTGIRFAAGSDAFHPFDPSTLTDRDDAIDIGLAGIRFDDIYATNGTIQTSDQNEKNTITDSDLGLDFVNRLTPKSYIFNGKTRTHYGLIAQEVETVLSDISKTSTDFAGFIKSDISEEQDGSEYRYGLRYNEFIAPMIKAIQELKADNDALRTRIETLENA